MHTFFPRSTVHLMVGEAPSSVIVCLGFIFTSNVGPDPDSGVKDGNQKNEDTSRWYK